MISPSVVETEGDQVVVNETEKARTILGKEAEESGAVPLPPVAAITAQTRTVEVQPAGPGHPATATTTTVTQVAPVSRSTSIVPAASSPAPDVGKARMPKDAPAVQPPTSLP